MSDHNFEKQVQQKLDELKVPPADKVWSSIEVRIRKDKRRRRSLILLPLVLLLIGGAFYYTAMQTGISDSKLVQKSSSSKNADNKNKSTSEKIVTTKDQSPRTNIDEKSSTSNTPRAESSAANPDRNETTPGKEIVTENSGKSNAEITSKPKTSNAGTLPEVNRSSSQKNENVVATKRRSQERSTAVKENVEKSPTAISERVSDEKQLIEEVVDVNKDRVKDNIPTDSAAGKEITTVNANVTTGMDSTANISAQASTDSSSAIGKSADKAPKKVKASSRLKWGATLSIGASSMVEGGILDGGLLGGIIGEEKALVADVAFNANPNSAPNNGAPPVSYKPSAIGRGLSFSIGSFIQKGISRRFSVSTGLQYSFYSTHIRVGNRVDSFLSLQNAFGSTSVGRYYTSAPVQTTSKYTNRFHFVEVPLSAHVQLNKGNKLPILWNAGVSLSYLVATNALHFDSRTGVYYRDNSLFNKLQSNLSTGLTISLGSKSAMPVHIGPQFQWGLTSLLKDDVSDKKRLSYFGLGAKFFLNK
jgi:Outer membrane protein beta-barrel domain